MIPNCDVRIVSISLCKISQERNGMAKQAKRKQSPVQSRAEIIRRLTRHKEEIKAFKATSLALFGSAARDELGRHSDVDVLVEFSTFDVDNYFALKFFLEDLLGRKIDLVREKAIRPRMLPYIQEELYAIAT